MLSPDTIRALCRSLLTAIEPATATTSSMATAPPGPAALPAATEAVDGADAPPEYALLVLHHGDALDAPPGIRCIASTAVPIHPALVDTYHGGLVGLLPEFAAALTPARHAAAAHSDESSMVVRQRAVEAITDVLAPPQPGMRLLACAIVYDDIHGEASDTGDPAAPCTVTAVRRIDAIDTDGRLYQVVQVLGQHAIGRRRRG